MKFSKAQAKEQVIYNDTYLAKWNDAISYLYEFEDMFPQKIKWERLNSCQAWTLHTDRYTFLRSYDTVVAVFDNYYCVLLDMLRYEYDYTATSAQHISKFKNLMRDRYCLLGAPIVTHTYYEVEK